MNPDIQAVRTKLAEDVMAAIRDTDETFQSIANRFQVSNSYVYERSRELRLQTGFQRRPKKVA